MMVHSTSAKLSLSSSLTASFSPGQVRYGRPVDAIDGMVPTLVVTARGNEDVSSLVREARRERVAIVAAGGGTCLDLGNPPRALDVRLNLTGMTGIVERHPDDMMVTVEAGVTLARLQKILAADHQRIVVDPALPTRATLGGIVAGNCTGAMGHGFRTPRDLVVALTVVDGTARTLRTGAKVVKNVAGYDLVRLFAGSAGTLGIITEVTIRTHPVPDQARTVAFHFGKAEELEAVVRAVGASELALPSAEFTVDTTESRLPFSFRACVEGTENAVEYQLHRLAELCCKLPAVEEATPPSAIHPREGETLVASTNTLPAGAVSLAQRLVVAGREYDGFTRAVGRPGDGFVRVAMAIDDVDHAADIVADLRRAAGQRLVVERAPASLKCRIDVWGPVPPGFELMRRLKQCFDPDSILAPGRSVGRM